MVFVLTFQKYSFFLNVTRPVDVMSEKQCIITKDLTRYYIRLLYPNITGQLSAVSGIHAVHMQKIKG